MNFNPNQNFYYYLYFISERMNIFWKRQAGQTENLTQDPILQRYKFTNVYRSLDRVSQYLIKNVIYDEKGLKNDRDTEDIFYRILLFKHFNKIETWEILEKEFGEITTKQGSIKEISSFLKDKIEKEEITPYSNAYMLTSAFLQGEKYKYMKGQRKHEMYLEIFKREIFDNKFLYTILASKSLEQLTTNLKQVTSMADFISMQITIDLNYSPLFNFDENEFVIAGVGAQRGLNRTFDGLKKEEYLPTIRYIQENLPELLTAFEFEFKPLPNRWPTLIDIQNCFCETSKYLKGISPSEEAGEKRIKNKFSFEKKTEIIYIFPPKWKVEI